MFLSDNRVKILFLSHDGEWGGAQTLLYLLVKGIDAGKYKSLVILPRPGTLEKRLNGLGVQTRLLPLEWATGSTETDWAQYARFSAGLRFRVAEIVKVIRQEQIDLVFTNTGVILEGALAACLCGVPHVWHILEIFSLDPKLFPIINLPRFYGLLDELTHKLIAGSKAVQAEIQQFIQSKKIEIVYAGVELPALESIRQDKSEIFGFDPNTPAISFVGLLSRRKGVLNLVDTAEIVIRTFPQAKFVIVGQDDGVLNEMQKQIATKKLSHVFEFLGFRTDYLDVVASADLLVLPSLIDTLPLIVLDAMKVRKPVVATRCGGIGEMVLEEETGLLVPVNDPTAMAQAIISLLRDPTKSKRMGEQGRRRVETVFSCEQFVANFERIFDQLILRGSDGTGPNSKLIDAFLTILDVADTAKLNSYMSRQQPESPEKIPRTAQPFLSAGEITYRRSDEEIAREVPKLMNVIFALPEGLTLGGVTSLSVEICRQLVKLGQSAALIEHSTMYGNPKLDFELPEEARVVSCTELLHPDDPRLNVREYVPVYRSLLPGVLIPNWAYGTFAVCAILAANEAENLRIIGYAHADEPGYYEWLSYYETVIHRFVASTQDIAGHLAKLLPHRQMDIIVRPNPINVPPVLQRGYSQAQMPVRLVYVARIAQRQKRVYDLVELASALAAENVDFGLRIIGDGVDKETLRAKFDDLSPAIRERVTLENSIAPRRLPEIWQAADISLLVSEYEGTSLAMLDSMAYGCVPVVTHVGGTSIIKPGVNGYRVPVGAVTEMAQIIKGLANDRQRLAWVGQKAHATIGAHVSYEQYVAWFLQMVRALWQEPPRYWPVDRPLLRVSQPTEPPSRLPGLAERITDGLRNENIPLQHTYETYQRDPLRRSIKLVF